MQQTCYYMEQIISEAFRRQQMVWERQLLGPVRLTPKNLARIVLSGLVFCLLVQLPWQINCSRCHMAHAAMHPDCRRAVHDAARKARARDGAMSVRHANVKRTLTTLLAIPLAAGPYSFGWTMAQGRGSLQSFWWCMWMRYMCDHDR